ncbi:MAG: MG2 domain-containing protein, partial [Ginsengibacter sp.]
MPDKDSLYLNALERIGSRYPENSMAAQASFLKARHIYFKALEINQNNLTSTLFTVKNAKNILDTLTVKFPKSEAGINAQNLINEIKHPELSLITEKVNIPGEPFRTLVKYRNVPQLHFRILLLTPELKKSIRLNQENEKVFSKLVSQKQIRQWTQKLPVADDFLGHSAEIKTDALPVGEYVLLASADAQFSLNKNPLAAQYFYVSNISFINSGSQYFVLDRTTGQPLSGARIQTWNTIYDYKIRDYQLTKNQLFTADKNGYFKADRTDKTHPNPSFLLEINYEQDHLFIDDQQSWPYLYDGSDNKSINYKNQQEFDKTNGKVFLFSDRSIYRPGQTVYFKGIGITKDWQTEKSILLQSKDSILVILRDANYQEIDSLKLSLNEFGSFNGKFKLPEGKMNGDFRIDVRNYSNSSVFFSVEEYKRPKFFTEFEKPKGSFRINDTIQVTGISKAYAGNNIDGAKVTYRVTRIARFLYPWMFRGKGFPNVQPMEIAHGETITDSEGKFLIQFKAIPDRNLDQNTDPVFDYQIVADVTDINGETRSGEIIVPVGYKALNLQINFPKGNILNADSLNHISLTSKNLAGENEPVKAAIKIQQLVAPNRLIRERLWEQPDTFIYSKDEYIQFFPTDEYKDESQKETWKRGVTILEKSDTISPSYQLSLTNKPLQQGWYVIEVSAKDKYGQVVKDVNYFQVFNTKSDTIPAPAYIWNLNENRAIEPGKTTKTTIGSSASNVFLIREIIKEKSIQYEEKENSDTSVLDFISLNNNKKTLSFNITEADRGGFGVNEFFVKNNRFYAATNTIHVPWTNKELLISFDTYRDKTLPGSEETWSVKISGAAGEKLAAEMLATMYDASLDQFIPHSWSKPSIWPTYNGYNNWQARQNFTTVNSIVKYWGEQYIPLPEKTYDALKFLPSFNEIYFGGMVKGMQVSREMDMSAAPVLGMEEKKQKEEFAADK